MDNDIDEGIFTLSRFKDNINLFCNNIREIFHKNYSFFSIGFIFLYAIEQGILLYYSILLSPNLAFGIGLFVLVLLTTISIERLLMESRSKRIADLNSYNLGFKEQYKEKIRILKEQNEKILELIGNRS